MNKKVICLYPEAGKQSDLAGLYLHDDLLIGKQDQTPLIYANFLASLDGRIAWRKSRNEHYQLPDELKSAADFRLFLELYAHADCIVTHGGYMRSLAAGRLGNVLQIPKLEWTQYIHEWRAARGLLPAPDVVILSGSLDFPWHSSLDQSGQQVHILTGSAAGKRAIQNWQHAGHEVHMLGSGEAVDAQPLHAFLQARKYSRVYLVAGPQLLQELLLYSYVDRFFMTFSHQLLGGEDFQSLIPDHRLGQQGHMQLRQLYMSTSSGEEAGQWYADFDVATKNTN